MPRVFRPAAGRGFASSLLVVLLGLFASSAAFAADPGPLDLTDSTVGFICVGLFVLAYALMMSEEEIQCASRSRCWWRQA